MALKQTGPERLFGGIGTMGRGVLRLKLCPQSRDIHGRNIEWIERVARGLLGLSCNGRDTIEAIEHILLLLGFRCILSGAWGLSEASKLLLCVAGFCRNLSSFRGRYSSSLSLD